MDTKKIVVLLAAALFPSAAMAEPFMLTCHWVRHIYRGKQHGCRQGLGDH
jgi:hypothetical protein